MSQMRFNAFSVLILFIPIGLILMGCTEESDPPGAKTFVFPNPVNTHDRPINTQKKQTYKTEGGLYADNQFQSARLNKFIQVNDSLFKATISPENTPINRSPWYAFRVWSEQERMVYIQLSYGSFKHRYAPKISDDSNDWQQIDDDLITYNSDSSNATIKLAVSQDTIWIAAQPLQDSRRVKDWCEQLAVDPKVHFDVIGQSTDDRDIYRMDMYKGERQNKDLIVLMGRQHPPEVTGFLAMKAFVENLVNSEVSDSFFDRYRVLIFPLLNPDGVDMGHWRHNANGVDLNRDWAQYRQQEVRQIVDHIVNEAATFNNRVVLGLDFHSTYKDVFYTNNAETMKSVIPEFRELWFRGFEEALGNGYRVNERPSNVGSPVSKAWFYLQFKAEGITYEIGDNTPRDFIEKKGSITSEEMMKALLKVN